MTKLPTIRIPPAYCQYSDGPCDQDFSLPKEWDGFFLYASEPVQIAETIEAAKARLQVLASTKEWHSWRDMPISGNVIFCEVCKAMRFSSTVVVDVTTLNFNLMFEIGFAIGLGLPVIPVRDSSYVRDKRHFEELGVLDVLGYLDFTNAEELSDRLNSTIPTQALPRTTTKIYSEAPLYVLPGPHKTEGVKKLFGILSKSGLSSRMYDPDETARLSLYDARKQVSSSIGVIAHLLSPNRSGYLVHNALCAFICGIAMAEQKVVVMLQEEQQKQPIDYRDVVLSYTRPADLTQLMARPIRRVVENLQRASPMPLQFPEHVLQQVDLGDPAAENEIAGLAKYFVPTSQFHEAKRGHARLVVGRKGTGKTALFYELQTALTSGRSTFILDLKPEGHQFIKLRELILDLTPGLQEHTMIALWTYLLLGEFANRILTDEESYSRADERRSEMYERLRQIYRAHELTDQDDLSERITIEIARLEERYKNFVGVKTAPKLTELIFRGDIRTIEDAVTDYLRDKRQVWLLIDNLDKGWSTRGTTAADILIIRSLLDASRKLQTQFAQKKVEFRCLVFLRTDIYDHLVLEAADKAKDTAIRLDWFDPLPFKDIVLARIQASTNTKDDFRTVWSKLFDSHIGPEESFTYVLGRTLMRPRDLLMYLRRAIEIAVNRGHAKVLTEDLLEAEGVYSSDMFLMTSFEIADTHPEYEDVLYNFHGTKAMLSDLELRDILLLGGITSEKAEGVIDLLLWFSFLGVTTGDTDDAQYSYSVSFNLKHLKIPVQRGRAKFVIHPAFRSALKV